MLFEQLVFFPILAFHRKVVNNTILTNNELTFVSLTSM